jgi:hypothetical protein
VLLLVPADPLRPRRADEHFAAEAAAARDAGIAVALIDHEALADSGGAQRAVARVPDADGAAVYRGWMMSSASYAALAGALAARGLRLRTGAAQYQRAHELPGWHQALAAVTPQAAWTDGDGQAGFRAACERLGPGPAVLRDYVKSLKHRSTRPPTSPTSPTPRPRGRSPRDSASYATTRSPAASYCAASRTSPPRRREPGGSTAPAD